MLLIRIRLHTRVSFDFVVLFASRKGQAFEIRVFSITSSFYAVRSVGFLWSTAVHSCLLRRSGQ